MAYQFESRVRYSEVGMDRKLTSVALVDYFQDCSTFQSEELGCGLDYMEEEHRAWMILSWQIEIQRKPELGEKIIVRTWPTGFKAFYGYRNFILLDEQENCLAKANSVWVNMDVSTGKPCRLLPEHTKWYEAEPELEMQQFSRKIQVPDGGRKMEAIPVTRHYLDTNHHVNNGQYLLMAEEYLPAGFEAATLRVEYRKQARLHDVIIPVVIQEEKEITVSLCDEAEKPYAVVVFAEK